GEAKIVLCLDPKELKQGETRAALEATGKKLPDYLLNEDNGLREPDSRLFSEVIDAIRRGPASRRLVRLVLYDSDVQDLVPQDVVSRSVAAAIKDLKNEKD